MTTLNFGLRSIDPMKLFRLVLVALALTTFAIGSHEREPDERYGYDPRFAPVLKPGCSMTIHSEVRP
jgi:hypothetical protein